MASGSSGRPSNSSGSKGFDFVSDDILCSYEDYPHQDVCNGTHSDSVVATNSTKVTMFFFLKKNWILQDGESNC